MPDLKGWKNTALVILGFLVIWQFTSVHASNKSVVSHLSLGSTLISIVLSVIAILYTLYQSTASTAQADRLNAASFQLNDSANKIGQSMREFDQVKIEVSTLVSASQAVTEQAQRLGDAVHSIEQFKAQIATAVEGAISTQLAPVRKDLGHISEKLESGRAKGVALAVGDEDVRTSFRLCSEFGFVFLYVGYRQSLGTTKLALTDVIKRLESQSFDMTAVDYIWGFLVGFASTRLIMPFKYSQADDNFAITFSDQRIVKIFLEEVHARRDQSEYFKGAMSEIDSWFVSGPDDEA